MWLSADKHPGSSSESPNQHSLSPKPNKRHSNLTLQASSLSHQTSGDPVLPLVHATSESRHCLRQSGDHSKVEPPGPVPNPEVKHFSADGSWTIGPVRVGRRQVICPVLASAKIGLFLCSKTTLPCPPLKTIESKRANS